MEAEQQNDMEQMGLDKFGKVLVTVWHGWQTLRIFGRENIYQTLSEQVLTWPIPS